MAWDDGIDGAHRQIAASPSRRIGVLAGPGTGKTQLGLMRRVARLLEEGTRPSEILLISFTRTAAHDLRTKIADLGIDGAEEITACTLHAFCFGVLAREAVLPITGRTPRPLLEHEVAALLRDLPREFGTPTEKDDQLRAYEAGWARQSSDHPGLTEPADREFETHLLRWLRYHQAMLIGELAPLAYRFLRDNPMAEDLSRYKHVIVDEYQDLNSLEQALLGLLVEPEDRSLCVAGDDDQSIYGFRFAHPQGILDFCSRGEVESLSISVCGRCPSNILAMANELIEHAPDRPERRLTALEDAPGTVAVVQWRDLEEEVDGIASAIAGEIQRGERSPGDFLVLVHRQRVGEMLRHRLAELEVPAHSFFSQEAVASEEAQGALAIMRLAVSGDRVSLRVLLGLGDSTARAAAYERLRVYCRGVEESEIEVLERLRRGEHLPLRVPALVSRYTAAMAQIETLPQEDLPAAIDHLFPAESEAMADLRAVALEEAATTGDLASLCEGIVSRIVQHDVPESPTYVRIMSLHKSKGLTSPAVFLIGMVDGIVPTIKSGLAESEAEAARNEQRRLVYVALTRAKEQLVISSCISIEYAVASGLGVRVVPNGIRHVGGRLIARTIASPYLAEIAVSAPRSVRGVDWLASRSS